MTTPAARYSDVGGLADVIQNIVELVEYPMTHPEIFAYLGLLTHVQMLTHQRNILVLAAGDSLWREERAQQSKSTATANGSATSASEGIAHGLQEQAAGNNNKISTSSGAQARKKRS